MNKVISHADGFQVVCNDTNGDQVILKFQTVAPEVIDHGKPINKDNYHDVVVQDVTVYMKRTDVKNLTRLLSEFII